MRRSSSAAVKMMTAIFASSDGWMPSGPTLSQRLAPFTGGTNRTTTSAAAVTPMPLQTTIGCR